MGDFALLHDTNSCIKKKESVQSFFLKKSKYNKLRTVCSVKKETTSESFFNTGCRTTQLIKRAKPWHLESKNALSSINKN